VWVVHGLWSCFLPFIRFLSLPVYELDDGHIGLVPLPRLLQLHDSRVAPRPLPEQKRKGRGGEGETSEPYTHIRKTQPSTGAQLLRRA